MNKSDLVRLLNSIFPDLSENNHSSSAFENFNSKYAEICEKIGSFETISLELHNITKHYFSNTDIVEWKFLVTNFYLLKRIGDILKSSNHTELLSVNETKTLKLSISFVVKIGIYTKLQPKLPFHVQQTYTNTDDIFYEYNILKCTTICLCEFLKNENLRILVLADSLQAILTALYQIAYCPLRKKMDAKFAGNLYNRLLTEKEISKALLNKLRETILPLIYIKETMVIFHQSAPPWFKKAISQMLTSIMLSPKGVENIAIAILDGVGSDKTKSWKALDVVFKLISSCKNQLDFRENICKQVVNLVLKSDENSLVFERLFVLCAKNFYLDDPELSKDVFVRSVVVILLGFTIKDYSFQEGDYTDHIKRSLRLLHAIFVEKTVESQILPVEILKPVLGVVFRIYSITLNSVLKVTNTEAKEIVLKYISDCPEQDTVVFDSFLFGMCNAKDILAFRTDLVLIAKGQNIVVKKSEHASVEPTSENTECLLKLLENNTKFQTRFFKYLLRCLVYREKYFKKANESLLAAESEIMNEYFERNLTVLSALSSLADDKKIQKEVINFPGEFIEFVNSVLKKTIDSNMHKTKEFESEGFQTVFTVIMILNALTKNYSKNNLELFEALVQPLQLIKSNSPSTELVDLITKILNNIDKKPTRMPIQETLSELDVILEDICDPLLPVRGHGLMALKKLIEKKDPSVMAKKQYILTIFQQNLKNDDSFIYLCAVDGLAAMANIFSDTVITTLCEEYSDFDRKGSDGHEVRIKLGEVLVRVTKGLGDMAPKYKAVLLNTFLVGTKDEDYLVRASSLSNLGEICRVLGYKLGTVITEVLVCVHAIIATDKSIEARRAAVTVIKQLLAGLESEMIAFLKEDLLPIYRTLKHIYHNDKDDVMRLQAQLALEELNENMTNFVFPKQQLNMEKKIIMLD